MSTVTIRIGHDTHGALKRIAKSTGESMQQVVERAISEYEKRAYLEGLKADYAALRADPEASADFDAENRMWDRTNADGLEGL